MFTKLRPASRRRWIGVLASIALSASAITVLEAAAAPTAAWAVSGLEVVQRFSDANSVSPKSATARCPAGKQVLGGGGGLVWTEQIQTHQIVLSQMQPVHSVDGAFRDYFVVTGVENTAGEPGTWYLESFAICADPMPGYEIVEHRSTTLSDFFIRTEAHCTGNRKVIGTGAKVSTNGGEVGLQVMRASTLATFSYAQAAEDFDGYFDVWNVTAYAVCADEPAGYEIVQTASPEDDSESPKWATALCSSGRRLFGAGSATGFSVPGHVALTHIIVNTYGDQRVDSFTMEVTPTDLDWDFTVAQAICAT
jgi:hypothetical protein